VRAAIVISWCSLLWASVIDPANGQATANPVAVAEDAFGSTEGDESVGIYDETSVRGFSLEAAGNYRINGRYFVKNSGVSNFFLEKRIVRIGYNALLLDHPGPSGVVDYKLRDPRLDEPSLLTVGIDPYEQPFAELHVKHRNAAETFSASIGASSRFNASDEQGVDGRDLLLAGTMRATYGPARVQIFGGEYRDRRNGRFRVALAADAAALPDEIERGRYLGQSWATNEGARRIVGALGDLDLANDWSLQAISVFSQEAPDRKFTQLFANVDSDGMAQSSVIISPVQRSSSYSTEVRLTKAFVSGAVAHSTAIDVRLRESRSRFGGERVIAAGMTALGEPASPVALPDLSSSRAALRDEIEQHGFGVSYQAAVRNRLKVGAGILSSDYSKEFTDARGAKTANESAPWLYNIGAALTVADGMELYGSYSRGLEEAGTAPATATNANAVLEAAIAAQKELGVRYRMQEDLTLILAGFETRKPQVGIEALTGAFDFLGNVRHRGVETSLSGALTPQLSTVLGAVYTDAQVSGVNVTSRLIGDRPVGVPTWRAIASFTYDFSPQWSADVGVEYAGERAIRSSLSAAIGTQLTTPDAIFVDVGARYRTTAATRPIIVRTQLLNALDKFAWKTAPGETLEYAPQRSLRVLVTMEF
jgi:iron complex outermembrane recepter protein